MTNDTAGTLPKETPVALLKPVPVSVTVVPPPLVPDDGLTAVTVGPATALYAKWSADPVVDVPVGVVTVISTVPAVPAGARAVSALSERTVKSRAAVEPKVTALAPVKPLPVTVTSVPPAALPD